MKDLIDIINTSVSRAKRSQDREQGTIISVSGKKARVQLSGSPSGQIATIPENIDAQVGQRAILTRAPRSKEWVVESVSGKSPTSLSIDYPTGSRMWHDECLITVGNPLSITIDATHRYGWYGFQSTAANGDTFTNRFLLKAGTYTFYALGRKGTGAGKIDWYVDNILIQSAQDWYNAAAANNTVLSVSNVIINTSGLHVLKGVVNGKNASSSGFAINLTKYWFVPASD